MSTTKTRHDAEKSDVCCEQKRRHNNDAALAEFIGLKAEIDAMLQRLIEASGDHFGWHPDAIDYGHVGTLAHDRDLLQRITDGHFREGEHAE